MASRPKIWHVRTRQWARAASRIFVKQSIAPLYDPTGRLQLISVPFFLLLVFLAIGPDQFEEEALLAWAALQALLYALPAFLLWNLLNAILSATTEIARSGKWINGRFIFHKPQHVFTTQFGPDDDQTSLPFG
jgi:hypothetical protein